MKFLKNKTLKILYLPTLGFPSCPSFSRESEGKISKKKNKAKKEDAKGRNRDTQSPLEVKEETSKAKNLI